MRIQYFNLTFWISSVFFVDETKICIMLGCSGSGRHIVTSFHCIIVLKYHYYYKHYHNILQSQELNLDRFENKDCLGSIIAF